MFLDTLVLKGTGATDGNCKAFCDCFIMCAQKASLWTNSASPINPEGRDILLFIGI